MSIKKTLRRRALSLVEETIYNLFNSVFYPWLDSTAQTVAFTTAPDGSNTAIRTQLVGTNTQFSTRRMNYITVGSHNFSCYAKKVIATTNAQFRIVINGNTGAGFDLNTGTINLSAGTMTPLIEDIGGGWYRCSVGLTVSSTSTLVMEYIGITTDDIFDWWGQQHTIGSIDLLPFQFTDSNTPR